MQQYNIPARNNTINSFVFANNFKDYTFYGNNQMYEYIYIIYIDILHDV